MFGSLDWHSWLRIPCLGILLWDSWFAFLGLDSGSLGFDSWIWTPKVGSLGLSSRVWIPDLDSWVWIPGLDSRVWIAGFGFMIWVPGYRFLGLKS